jgi:hypothetical protein
MREQVIVLLLGGEEVIFSHQTHAVGCGFVEKKCTINRKSEKSKKSKLNFHNIKHHFMKACSICKKVKTINILNP